MADPNGLAGGRAAATLNSLPAAGMGNKTIPWHMDGGRLRAGSGADRLFLGTPLVKSLTR